MVNSVKTFPSYPVISGLLETMDIPKKRAQATTSVFTAILKLVTRVRHTVLTALLDPTPYTGHCMKMGGWSCGAV